LSSAEKLCHEESVLHPADDLVMVGKFLVDVAQRPRTAVAEKIWLENEPHRFGFNRIDFEFLLDFCAAFCAALLGASISL
jgi:hypothetical protein